ncbi:hypothetical protein ACQBAT_05890 [Ornithinimicrobium sp. Y1847]|uniref:hypothetical protein n=1 Tax=unclassified Ornithinimicrobium TaxID=2615080 RepID=UPI003B67D78A
MTAPPPSPQEPDDGEDVDRQFHDIVDGMRLGPGTQDGMASAHRSYEAPELAEDDHFVPPPTPPLPAGDLHFWAITIGLAGGLLLVLVSAVFPILDRGWSLVGGLLIIIGFVLLVLRLPRNRQPDGDWGAQV